MPTRNYASDPRIEHYPESDDWTQFEHGGGRLRSSYWPTLTEQRQFFRSERIATGLQILGPDVGARRLGDFCGGARPAPEPRKRPEPTRALRKPQSTERSHPRIFRPRSEVARLEIEADLHRASRDEKERTYAYKCLCCGHEADLKSADAAHAAGWKLGWRLNGVVCPNCPAAPILMYGLLEARRRHAHAHALIYAHDKWHASDRTKRGSEL